MWNPDPGMELGSTLASICGTGLHFCQHFAGLNGTGSTFPSILLDRIELGSTFASILLGLMLLCQHFSEMWNPGPFYPEKSGAQFQQL